MHSTSISPRPRAIVKRDNNGARLNWLLAANEAQARHRMHFRNGYEEEQMLLLRRPMSAEHAYAVFGMMLGALPPAAIFVKLFGYGLTSGSTDLPLGDGSLFFLCAVMNVVCGLSGYVMGSILSRRVMRLERSNWIQALLLIPMLGAVWGVFVGVVSGFFYFGISAYFGVAYGVPIGLVGFLVLAILHRTLERGGMIELRHFLPLAFGITAAIAALIIGL